MAVGVMGFSPKDFWSMTLAEFEMALDGWMIKTHGKHWDSVAPMTQEELDNLMERFPDAN